MSSGGQLGKVRNHEYLVVLGHTLKFGRNTEGHLSTDSSVDLVEYESGYPVDPGKYRFQGQHHPG